MYEHLALGLEYSLALIVVGLGSRIRRVGEFWEKVLVVAEAVESPRRLLCLVMKNDLRGEALETKHVLAIECAVGMKHVLVLTKALACCYASLLGSARGDSSDNFPFLFWLL